MSLEKRYRHDWFHLEAELHANASERVNAVDVGVASAADLRVGVTLVFAVFRLTATALTFMIL